MSIVQKIKLACTYANISEAELARRLNMSPQSLNNRMKTGKFTYEELTAMGKALGAVFDCSFTFEDGTAI